MDWLNQPFATLIAAVFSAVLSAVTLHKLQNKKSNDDTDLKAFGHSLDKKFKEFESTLIEHNSYLAEKGKQAATKEDLEAITRTVESIKTEFITSLEVLKLELSKKSNLHKLQAEKEFVVYSIIWDKAIDLRFAAETLGPAFDTVAPDPKERWADRYAKIGEEYNALREAVEKQRPFYPDSLHQQLTVLIGEVHNEIIDFEFSFKDDGFTKMTTDGYRRGQKNLGKILSSLNDICDLMRSRISES